MLHDSVTIVVLTWTHRYNGFRGQRTGSNNSGNITSGGKQTKTEDNTHNNWNKSYTSDKQKYVRSAYVRIKIHIYHMLNESQQKLKPTRQHSTHKKKTGWNKRCLNRNRKREGREEENKDNSTSATQERRQHARGIRILQAGKERGGGVAPRRNNRITESATKESREAKVKAKKAIQESNGKLQD